MNSNVREHVFNNVRPEYVATRRGRRYLVEQFFRAIGAYMGESLSYPGDMYFERIGRHVARVTLEVWR